MSTWVPNSSIEQVRAKPARCDNFVAIFHVAQNPLKLAMSTLFVLKNVRVFFSKRQKNMDNIAWKSTTPNLSLYPSPNKPKISTLRAKSLCVCVLRYWRVGGGGGGCEIGGGTFKKVFEALFPRLWTFFHRKRVGMANFSGFKATCKIATKSSNRAGLHGPSQRC